MAPATQLADPRRVSNLRARLPLRGETSTLRPVPRAHVLLIESIHPSADEAFARADIAVHRRATGLAEDELIATLQALPGDEPVLLGIRSKTQVRAAVFESVPRLAAVGAFCIGTDQIQLEAARQSGIAVFNAPFSNTRSVAELVIAEIVMLSFTRCADCGMKAVSPSA